MVYYQITIDQERASRTRLLKISHRVWVAEFSWFCARHCLIEVYIVYNCFGRARNSRSFVSASFTPPNRVKRSV